MTYNNLSINELNEPRYSIQDLLDFRGIKYPEDVCLKCHGWGCRAYANTSTWRKGIGGNAITMGPCDRCWGSGRKENAWPSHRTFEQYVRKYGQVIKFTEDDLRREIERKQETDYKDA